MAEQEEGSSIVVVANRLPVDHVVDNEGVGKWQRSPGGLVTALAPVVSAQQGTWVGWAGSTGPAPKPFSLDGMNLKPVALSDEEIENYYEGFSNSTLWPLYHNAPATPNYHRHWWDSYVAINERFAAAAADSAPEGAVVWIHDYQLQLVPMMLRHRRPDLRIGFFLHIPFPPVELFTQLPWRSQILEGLLGADLLGFQQHEGAQNFLRLARFLSGYETDRDAVLLEDRSVQVAAFPISIDFPGIDALANDPATLARAVEIRKELGNPRHIILGVDRLDYTKGIGQRLKAFRELLGSGELRVGEVVLVQVATPSRDRVKDYQDLREKIEREVGRINGEFGELGTSAVHYLRHSYDTAELVALYRAADVMLVTPLRDGMNLVAKEYVAARPDHGGALVLSEFTGAAEELTGAFFVNPYDVLGVKRAILRALEVEPNEGSMRMATMRRWIAKHDIVRWSRQFLEALEHATRALPLPDSLADVANAEGDVWVLSDYDGTLSPFSDNPATAGPAPGARDVLNALASIPRTHVAIVSGRPIASVRALLGLPDDGHIAVLGRHGFEVDSSLGESLALTADQRALSDALRASIQNTLDSLRVPYAWSPTLTLGEEAVLEDKASSIAVHVRRLPKVVGRAVLAALSAGPARLPGVVVTPGAMVLEFAVTTATKGDAVHLIRARHPKARILVLGDDITDLDTIGALEAGDAVVLVGDRLSNLAAAERRGTLRSEIASRLTQDVIAQLGSATEVSDPFEAVALLRRWASEREAAVRG